MQGITCLVFVDSIRVIGFDHRKSVLAQIPSAEDHPDNLTFHIDIEKSSSSAVYEYFSDKLADIGCPDVSRN
jgi:hypothetical protein